MYQGSCGRRPRNGTWWMAATSRPTRPGSSLLSAGSTSTHPYTRTGRSPISVNSSPSAVNTTAGAGTPVATAAA